MRFHYWVVFTVLFLTTSASWATERPEDFPSCEEDQSWSLDGADVTQRDFGEIGCLLDIDPANTRHAPSKRERSRKFQFFESSGALTVIENYSAGGGRDSQNTAVQEILFFPTANSARIAGINENEMEATILLSNQEEIQVDLQNGVIQAISGAEIDHNPEISRNSIGGFEASSSEHMLILNVHGHNGNLARTNRYGTSEWIGPGQTSCTMLNHKLFDYRERTPRFAYNDEELLEFLEEECPELDTTPLKPPAQLLAEEVIEESQDVGDRLHARQVALQAGQAVQEIGLHLLEEQAQQEAVSEAKRQVAHCHEETLETIEQEPFLDTAQGIIETLNEEYFQEESD